MKLIFVSVLVIFLGIQNARTQNLYTIHGYVKDSLTGETLRNAHIVIQGNNIGTVSNRYGFYSLTLPEKAYTLVVSMMGYDSKSFSLSLSENTNNDFLLSPQSILLPEITFEIEDDDEGGLSTDPFNYSYKIQPQKIKDFPRLMGEPDLLKVLQSLPGIQHGNEGSAGLHVRGGSPDQNLLLVDGTPVYNVFHLFGFLSVFNTDAIKDVKVYKQGIPSVYEGRLSSIIDISLKEGNLKDKKGSYNISPIAGSFVYETPIKKDKSSIIISGRRTWLDGVFQLLSTFENNTSFNFYDVSVKYHTKLDDKNDLYTSFYGSRDKFFSNFRESGDKNLYSFNWQNQTGLIRWNRILNRKTFLNQAFNISHYRYSQLDEFENEDITHRRSVYSSINDISYTAIFDYFPNPYYNLSIGTNLGYQSFQPEVHQSVNEDLNTSRLNGLEKRIQTNIFINSTFDIAERINLMTGLRFSWLNTLNEFYVQPRISINYEFGSGLALNAAYDNIAQTLHLLTNTSLGQPTDLWVPANQSAPTEKSKQLSFGIWKSWREESVELQLNVYKKKLDNLIEYKDGTNFLFGESQNWIDKIEIGTGESKGVELLLKKNKGIARGWVSYTLSSATRQFMEINGNKPFPYKYDRRHNFSATGFYKINQKKKFSLFFTFNSGHNITLPISTIKTTLPPGGEFFTDGFADVNEIGYVQERNNYRMPNYHRLDISYQTEKIKENGKRSWIISIYNIYNRLNTYFIYQKDGELKNYTLFPILPSITYRREF